MSVAEIWEQISGPLAFLMTLVSLALAIYSVRLAKKLRTVSVGSVRRYSSLIALKLRRRKFSPDVILCPDVKNGLIAHFIRDRLNAKVIIVGFQVYRKDEDPPADRPGFIRVKTNRSYLYFPDTLRNYKDDNILFVDSVHKSGSTLDAVRSELHKIGFSKDKMLACCLVHNDSSPNALDPDFYIKKMGGDIFFPWGTVRAN